MNNFYSVVGFIMSTFIANGGFVYVFFINLYIKISKYYFNVWISYLIYILL